MFLFLVSKFQLLQLYPNFDLVNPLDPEAHYGERLILFCLI